MSDTTKKSGSDKKEKSTAKTAAKAPAKKAAKAGEETHASAAPKAKTKPKGAPSAPRRPLLERTYFPKPGQVTAQWRLVDATGIPVGRLATQIAVILMGKDKPVYTRSTDTGDFVIVINASKVVLTGKKWEQKVYQKHTNYPGGLKTLTAMDLRTDNPAYIIEKAVQRMLPTGHMGRAWIKKLRVFAGADHPHAAQQPQAMKLRYATSNREI